jgi:DNA-binding CsgD family transcriptional regulator
VENLFVTLLNRRGQIIWTTVKSNPGLEGRLFTDLVIDEDRELMANELSGCIVGGKSRAFTSRWHCPSPPQVNVLTVLHPVEPSEGLTVSAVSIQRHIPNNFAEFNEADRALLKLLSQDQTIKEVATAMSRSESTIDARIKHLKVKMGSQTLHGLVASAFGNSLVPMLISPDIEKFKMRA